MKYELFCQMEIILNLKSKIVRKHHHQSNDWYISLP